MSDTPQTDTPATPDAIWRSHKAAWADTVLAAINESLGADLTEESDAYTVANRIKVGIDNLRTERNAACNERDNAQGALTGARSLYGTILDAERNYNQTLADRLGIPYDTVKDAAALCDTLAPRLAVESAAIDEVAAASAFYLPDLITPDDDGHLPTPGKAILMLAQEVVKARAALTRANEALNNAKTEADALRSTLAVTQADLLASDRARDEFRDATRTLGQSLAFAGSACANLASIR
jgi:hypothetical protein